jgi:hypothetical protein
MTPSPKLRHPPLQGGILEPYQRAVEQRTVTCAEKVDFDVRNAVAEAVPDGVELSTHLLSSGKQGEDATLRP